MDELREAFRCEAEELLSELETALLELEECPGDGELVGRAFRALHTIKGSGAMAGYDGVAAFAHGLEDAFDRVRSGAASVTPRLVTVALGAKDHLRALLWGEPAPGAGEAILAEVGRLCAAPEDGAGPGRSPAACPTPPPQGTQVFRIRFRPHPCFFADGADPATLLADLQALGSCRVEAHTGDVPDLDGLDPQVCHTRWDVVLTTERGLDAVRDVFLLVEDRCDLSLEPLDGTERPRLGEILASRGDLTPQALAEALGAQRKVGEILQERGLVTPGQVRAALAEQQALAQARSAGREGSEPEASIRVPAAKLDTLVDLVGELVIAQARLTQVAGERADAALLAVAEDVERLATSLRDNALAIRMLPIGTTFGRFRRLVRDLSSELGKQVELATFGAETELDKTVLDRLGDPLVHLIRNALDHGVEPPEERRRAGKPERATVRLAAAHSGANVVLEIRDDGRGLDAEAIRAKAVERGLLAEDQTPTERELYDLVFAPGFSTAKAVTGVSGRGVGMDVVRRSIASLRGTVELESRRGQGTTVRIRLPLTLAIIEGLLVRVGGDRYVLPLGLVEECVELTPGDRLRARGRLTAEVRGHLVPYVRLRDWFRVAGPAPGIEQVVVVRVEGERYGFAVDHVVGQHQTVIKSLGRVYQEADGLSGATILGDGSVALILDAPRILAGRLAAGP